MFGGAGTVCGRAAGALINALRLAESFDMVRILRESGIDLVMLEMRVSDANLKRRD